VSSGDFFIPPSPYTAADVEFTGRMAMGESKTVTINTANKIGLVVFDGTAGQHVNLGITGVTISQSDVTIYKPHGTALSLSTFVTTSGRAIDLSSLPVTGTYTILIDPRSTYTGSMTLTLSEDIAGSITIDGSPLTVNITRPGQDARITFGGTAAQLVGLGITNATMGSAFSGVWVSIVNPDGTTLGSANVGTTGGEVDGQLPVPGTYTVLVDPGLLTGSVTLTLSEDIAGSIVMDGAPLTVTLRPGQDARLTFNGTAAQQVSLGATAVTIGSGCCSGSWITVFNPDSTVLVSTLVFLVGADIDFPALPQTGTYTMLVDPDGANTGTMTLTLSKDIPGTITVDGAPLSVNISRPGQKARITFNGTTAQQMSLGMTGVTISQSDVFIYKPDGTTLLPSTFVATSGAAIDFPSLPVSGTYTILINPRSTRTGSMTLTLSEEINAGTTTVNGSSVTVSIPRPGQTARLTFSGTVNQQVTVRVTGNTMGVVNVALLRQSGTTVTSSISFGSSFNLAQVTLPATETYTILINPSGVNTGSMNVSITNP
jgi:hypothetical protein